MYILFLGMMESSKVLTYEYVYLKKLNNPFKKQPFWNLVLFQPKTDPTHKPRTYRQSWFEDDLAGHQRSHRFVWSPRPASQSQYLAHLYCLCSSCRGDTDSAVSTSCFVTQSKIETIHICKCWCWPVLLEMYLMSQKGTYQNWTRGWGIALWSLSKTNAPQ